MNRTILALLTFAACRPDETGIDHTVVTGTVEIPPVTLEEVDTRTETNDLLDAPQGLGPEGTSALPYRTAVVTGNVKSWTPEGIGAEYGDPDYFTFTPAATGTFTISLTFAATAGPQPPPADTGDTATTDSGGDTSVGDTSVGDTSGGDTSGGDTSGGDTSVGDTSVGDTSDTGAGYSDAVVYQVEIYDMASYDADAGTGILLSTTTDGSAGAFSTTVDLAADGEYVVLIAGIVTPDLELAGDYSLKIESAAPGDLDVLIGAYAGSDPLVAEAPLGGTTANTWEYDAETMTWSGAWRMYQLREVTAVPDEDTGDLDIPNPEIEEGNIKEVSVRGGSVATLNSSPMAGDLYASAATSVSISGAEVAVDAPIVLDAVRPKVLGIVTVEEEPDATEAHLDADYLLVLDTLAAQDIGVVSGLGFVDTIDGVLNVVSDSGVYDDNDSDAYAFQVAEELHVTMTAGFDNAAADLDFGLFGEYDGVWLDYTDYTCFNVLNPELCTTVVPLQPGATYYVLALGYSGIGDDAYHIELEWAAP